jgi:integrase
MKMALPRGMFRRGNVLWARKDVPAPLREIIGQTSLQQTLGTGDVNLARVVFHTVMTRFEARIADARARLASESKTFEPIFFTPEQLGFTQEQAHAYLQVQQSKPEVQAKAAVDRIERKLVDAGLVTAEPERTTMDELFQRWVRERQPRTNSKNECERAKDLFVKLNTSKPITEYTSTDARKFKDHIVDMNAPNGQPLAHGSKLKWFGAVKTLFRLADKNDLLTVNPFSKITLEKPKNAKEARREEWEIEELRILFGSPVYTQHKRFRAGAGEAAYWLPVLALYHGFRAGELCQLDAADVLQRAGIWCLAIRPSHDDGTGGKSVKTDKSVRFVPLHSAVIALGFLEYLRSIKAKKLFPSIKVDQRGSWSEHYSKWFSRYRKEIGLGRRWLDFHSFRHGWKTAARSVGIPKEIHDEITGHEGADAGSGYGHVPIPTLKSELEKISFDLKIQKWKGSKLVS